MFKCHICPYTTSRKFNLKTHLNKKLKCVPISDPNNSNGPNSIQNEPGNSVQKCQVEPPNQLMCKGCDKCFQTTQSLNKHSSRCKGRNDPKECQTCYKVFSTSKARAKHNKLVFCKRPDDLPETFAEKLLRLEKEIENVKQENEMLKSQSVQATTINNTTNNNINIVYNNYDKPNIAHITNNVMKTIYEMSQRDPVLILNETVRRIYKNEKYPENHVIKMGEKAAFSRVFKDGKEICLPMDGVIQTVMSNTGELCADILRDCHEEGEIKGTKVVIVYEIMETLGTDARDEDAVNRSIYFQSIKSAFM